MGLLDCLSMMTVAGNDAQRELFEDFQLGRDLAGKNIEEFIVHHVPLRSCRWRLVKMAWNMFQRQIKVLTNHGIKLWCDHCSSPTVVNWSFATGSWACGECGPKCQLLSLDRWLPRFCWLRHESLWSKIDEDDAGFYDGWSEEECLGQFLLLWIGKDQVANDRKAVDDCEENVSIASLMKKMNREEKSRTTAIAVRKCGEKENYNVIPRILGGGNGQVSRRRVERGTAPVSADESNC